MLDKITMDTPVAEAVRQYWLYQIQQIRQQIQLLTTLPDHPADAAEAAQAVEAIHDLRVSVRRCQSLALASAPYLTERWPEKIEYAIAPLRKATNKLRDLDVCLEWLAVLWADAPADSPASELRQRLEHQRRREYANVIECLHDKRQLKDLGRLEDRLAQPDALDRLAPLPLNKDGECQMYRIRDVAAAMLLTRAAAITVYRLVLPTMQDLPEAIRGNEKLAASLLEPADRSLHHLRVAGKDFRYTLEMLAPALGPAAQPLLAAFKSFQDALGQLHDRVTASALLRALAEHEKIKAESEWTQPLLEKQALLQQFMPIWAEQTPQWYASQILALFSGPVAETTDNRFAP